MKHSFLTESFQKDKSVYNSHENINVLMLIFKEPLIKEPLINS